MDSFQHKAFKGSLVLLFTLMSSWSLMAQIDRSIQPQPKAAPKIQLEDPQTFTLSNGLKVLVVENHKLPRVRIQLLLDNPPVLEGEKAGVSSLTGALLGKGSSNISKDDFNEEVDFLGATISFSGQSAFASTLSRYFPRILELMAEAALNPNFSQEEFEKEKERFIENLRSEEKDVSAVARRVQSALAYGTGHPYGEFVSIESLEKVTLEDVSNFYARYFSPDNAYLVLIGDLDVKTAKKLVKTHFKDWSSKLQNGPSYSEATNLAEPTINFVDMPNAVQSEIVVQNLVSLKMSDPDYIPVLIANQILGGGAEGRLFLNLREDKGYTYGSYSSVGTDKYSNARFRASAQVRNAVTDSAVVEILSEIKKIGTERVSEVDLKNAKEKYKGSFVRSLERPETVANFALNIETQGLSADFYENYLSRIDAVTAEEVQRVAQKYFKVDQARIVVVGKGSEVLPALEKMQFDSTPLKVAYFDKFAAAIDRPEFKIELPEGVTAASVLNAYLEAIGGREAASAVKTFAITYGASVQGMNLQLVVGQSAANEFTQEMKMMGNVMQRTVITETEAFMEAQGQKIPLNDTQKKTVAEDAALVSELFWLTNPNAEMSLIGIEMVDDRPTYAVKVSENRVAYYDTETGLKLKQVTTQEMQGQTISQSTSFGDYKEVSGILIPHVVSQNLGPQTVDFTIEEAKIN
ncbi:MAG: M16 family metallopeptidase [Flavobacteriaceae bacterium]